MQSVHPVHSKAPYDASQDDSHDASDHKSVLPRITRYALRYCPESVCRDLPNLRLYTYRGHHHAGVPLMADSEIATIEMREFLAKMPVLEARFAKYEAALKAIAKEGDNDTGTAPAIFLTAVGHLNCRMLAKAALEPSPIYI
jgi:hypothetical protein